jgi:hypothetical protein
LLKQLQDKYGVEAEINAEKAVDNLTKKNKAAKTVK